MKPGSKALVAVKSGALTQRVHAKEDRPFLKLSSQRSIGRLEAKKNYVVLKNPRQSIVQPPARVTSANMPVRVSLRDNRGSDGSPLTPRVARVDNPDDI